MPCAAVVQRSFHPVSGGNVLQVCGGRKTLLAGNRKENSHNGEFFLFLSY